MGGTILVRGEDVETGMADMDLWVELNCGGQRRENGSRASQPCILRYIQQVATIKHSRPLKVLPRPAKKKQRELTLCLSKRQREVKFPSELNDEGKSKYSLVKVDLISHFNNSWVFKMFARRFRAQILLLAFSSGFYWSQIVLPHGAMAGASLRTWGLVGQTMHSS